MRSGVLVIDKPRGPTSHDVVATVRRVLDLRRVGHAGTLDPMATGVLVVAVGEATKLVPWLSAQDKAYVATIALGVETDTLDADGRETRRKPLSHELRIALSTSRRDAVAPALRDALDRETARAAQVPPMYSAVKEGGERSYMRARRGESRALGSRAVSVRKLELLECSGEPPLITVAVEVSKGYYVRGLARDLASALGTVGHLTSLRRPRSGCFLADEAISFQSTRGEVLDRMQSVVRAASRVLPVAGLTGAGADAARQGRPVFAQDIAATAPGPCAWIDPCGELVAVGALDETGTGRVIRGFVTSDDGR
jgi:tRNA pseudouridine55 synthase